MASVGNAKLSEKAKADPCMRTFDGGRDKDGKKKVDEALK